MNTKQVYFKARQTILEMFKDRGYKGPYEQSNMFASQFYEATISNNGSLNQVDLKGFYEERNILDPANYEQRIIIKIPIYVHFTKARTPKSKKSEFDHSLLYKNILNDETLRTMLNEYNNNYPDSFQIDYNELNVYQVAKSLFALLGVHILIVYDGWDYAQNKEPIDLTFVYSSGERDSVLYDLEIWPVHTLVVNYTRHSLVPKHELFTVEQKTNFLADQAEFYLNENDRKKYDSLENQVDKTRFMENYMFQVMPKIGLNDPINLYYHGRLRQIYQIIRHGKSPTYRMVRRNPLLKDVGK